MYAVLLNVLKAWTFEWDLVFKFHCLMFLTITAGFEAASSEAGCIAYAHTLIPAHRLQGMIYLPLLTPPQCRAIYARDVDIQNCALCATSCREFPQLSIAPFLLFLPLFSATDNLMRLSKTASPASCKSNTSAVAEQSSSQADRQTAADKCQTEASRS